MLNWEVVMSNQGNQRIRLTKQLLQTALLKLLKQKPLHLISIRELCDEAGINRTTFYHHYGSQFDLLNEISAQFLDSISERLSHADPENRESVSQKVTTVMEYFSEQKDLSKLLLNNTFDSSFGEKIFSLPKITDLFNAALSECEDETEKKARITFAIHGSFRLLQEWINDDLCASPAKISELVLMLARSVCQ